MDTFIVDNGKGEILQVGLDEGVVESAADEPFDIVDSVQGIHCHHVLGGIANESLTLIKDDTGRCGPVAVVIFNDLNLTIPVDTYTRVGGAQINTDSWGINSSSHACI